MQKSCITIIKVIIVVFKNPDAKPVYAASLMSTFKIHPVISIRADVIYRNSCACGLQFGQRSDHLIIKQQKLSPWETVKWVFHFISLLIHNLHASERVSVLLRSVWHGSRRKIDQLKSVLQRRTEKWTRRKKTVKRPDLGCAATMHLANSPYRVNCY